MGCRVSKPDSSPEAPPCRGYGGALWGTNWTKRKKTILLLRVAIRAILEYCYLHSIWWDRLWWDNRRHRLATIAALILHLHIYVMKTLHYYLLVFYLVAEVACEPVIEVTFFEVNGIKLHRHPWFFLIIIYFHGDMVALCHYREPIALNHPGTTNSSTKMIASHIVAGFVVSMEAHSDLHLRPGKQHPTHYKDNICTSWSFCID